MPTTTETFAELHKLIDQKAGDFRLWYKIGNQGALSAYDVLNSPKVNDHLTGRKTPSERLSPGRLDADALKKRCDAAFNIARAPHVQNKDANFTSVASTVLNKARELLADEQTCKEYAAWLRARARANESDDGRRQVEKEKTRRRKAEEREKQLQQELVEAKERAERLLAEKKRLAAAEAREREQRLLAEKKRSEEAKERDREKQLQKWLGDRKIEEPDPEPPPEEEKRSSGGLGEFVGGIVQGFLQVAQARREAAAAAPAPRLIDISGVWQSYDGMAHYFNQAGSAVSMQVRNPLGIVVTQGRGTIVGNRIRISYQIRNPFGFVVATGEAEAEVSADSHNIQGYYRNFSTGQTGVVNLYR